MKKYIYAVLIVMLAAGPCFSQSLFEEYTNSSREELTAQTRELSREIKDKFSQQSLDLAQQKIDYYDYLSNLKNMVLYADKLSTYAEYEKDLKFARDNELFKGLPEDRDAQAESASGLITAKYQKMRVNVKDEIDTYEDLTLMSLDSCELLVSNDLSGFVSAVGTAPGIRRFFDNSPAFRHYLENRDRLARAWPGLESRIRTQISLWQEKGMAPEDPLIDPKLTKAIADDNAV